MYRQIKLSLIFALIWFTNPVVAHQMVPSHVKPEWYGDKVNRVTLTITNMRKDVRHFLISVYDKDFSPVVFATPEKLLTIEHLERKKIEVFTRKGPEPEPYYVCSLSKLTSDEYSASIVATRVCSRIQE